MGLRTDIAKIKTRPVPKGWQTSAQLAKAEAMSLSTAQRNLKVLMEAGIWEQQKWQILEKNGYIKTCLIYRRKPSQGKGGKNTQ